MSWLEQAHSLNWLGRVLVLGPHDPSGLSWMGGRTKSRAILEVVVVDERLLLSSLEWPVVAQETSSLSGNTTRARNCNTWRPYVVPRI